MCNFITLHFKNDCNKKCTVFFFCTSLHVIHAFTTEKMICQGFYLQKSLYKNEIVVIRFSCKVVYIYMVIYYKLRPSKQKLQKHD